MQRDEKIMDSFLDSFLQRATDIRVAIANLLHKLEHDHENLSWHTVLDNFALLSSQLNTLGQFLKGDKKPNLRSYSFLPLMLSPDIDSELEKLSEGRLRAFNHEVVPDYLRTKPEPEAEERLLIIRNKASSMNQEVAQKQLNNLNRITNNICDVIASSRTEWEREGGQKMALPQTSSVADTHALVIAMTSGKGIKLPRRGDLVSPQQPSMMMPTHQPPMKPSAGESSMKAVSSIKTNIRSGGHPYQRP